MGMHVDDNTILYSERDISLILVGVEKIDNNIRLFGNLLYPSDFDRFADARMNINGKSYQFNLKKMINSPTKLYHRTIEHISFLLLIYQ